MTDVTLYWGQPSFKVVAYASGAVIDFTSATSRKHQLDASLQDSGAPPAKAAPKDLPGIDPTSSEELDRFFDAIQFKNSGIKPAILSVVRGYCDEYVDKTSNIAPILTDLLDESNVVANYSVMLKQCEELMIQFCPSQTSSVHW